MARRSIHPHHNGNLLAAVDIETTGTDPSLHEIIQIGIQPLNADFEPHQEIQPFYSSARPLLPDNADPMAMRVHHLTLSELEVALHPDEVEDLLVEWFESLELPFERRLIPVAHNYPFEKSFLTKWLGVALHDQIFLGVSRDSQAAATYLNEKAALEGRDIPFQKVTLTYLTDYFSIPNTNPHDALNDAIAGARLYRKLLEMDVLL